MTIRLKSYWQREQKARRRRGASSPKKEAAKRFHISPLDAYAP